MFYTREEKQLLGRYFKYYREEKNITIKEITSTGICEYRTYKRIEEGKIKNNDELFDLLLNYFQIDYTVIEALRNMNPLIDDLYDACEWYDCNQIKKVLTIMKKRVKNLINKPIIFELLNSLNFIEKLYISNQYVNYSDLKQVFKYSYVFGNKISSLLMEVCGKSNLNYILKNEVFCQMKPYLQQKDNICKYWYARICVYDVNYIEAEEIYKLLLEYYSDNLLRKARIIMDLHALYRDTDYKKAEEYTTLMIQLTALNLPESVKEAIYYNLGMYYYLKEDYKEALINYQKSNEIIRDSLTVLFIYACRSRLDYHDQFDFEIDYEHSLNLYLKYFKMKFNNEDENILEKYILEELMDLLLEQKYEQPFWKMFSFEMSILVKKTRNYKKYLEFQEKMQFATKNAA